MKVKLGLLINSQRAVIKLVGGQYTDEAGVHQLEPEFSPELSAMTSDLAEQYQKRLDFWNKWRAKIAAPLLAIQAEFAKPGITPEELEVLRTKQTEALVAANKAGVALGESVVALHGVDKIPFGLLKAEPTLKLSSLDISWLKQWLLLMPEAVPDDEQDEIPPEFDEPVESPVITETENEKQT